MTGFRNNPIFSREFTAAARGVKLLIAITALIFALSFILFMLWPRTGIFSRFDSNELFMVFLAANLGLLIFTSPLVTASAITDEKERNTFEQLFLTLLSPFDIMTGKLLSAMGMVLLIIFITMPVTAICALSGGISIPFLIKTYGIIILAVFTYSLMGLAISAWCQHSFSSILLTYLGIMGLAGAVWLPAALLQQFDILREPVLILRTLSPFEALAALYDPIQYEVSWGRMSPQTAVYRHIVGMLGLAVIFFSAFCVLIFRPPGTRHGKRNQQALYNDFRTSLKRKMGFPFYLIDPLKRKKPIAGWRNPVFVAELRSKIFGNPKFIVRALSTCITISLLLIFLVTLQYGVISQDQIYLTAVLFQFAVVVFFAPVVSSGSITEETTTGTFEQLRMTPVTAWTLVLGKFKAAFIYVLIFLISSIPVFFAIMYMQTDPIYWRIGAWMLVLIIATLAFTMFGLFASSIMKSTAAATALSYSFAFVLTIGTLSVLMFGDRISREAQAVILTFNPLIAAVQLTTDQWFADYPLIFNNPMWRNTIIAYLGIFAVILVICAVRVHALFSSRD